jgi:SRSO17 transposase
MRPTYGALERQLKFFLDEHLHGLENDERIEALAWYCQGLGLELPQKTIYGIAERLAPDHVQSVRQRMQRAIQRSRFGHEDIFGRLQQTVFASAESIAAYCIDDTGFPKKGRSSVGVQRQYSGTLGKIGNCQVSVTLHALSSDFSACIGGQLFLPESWVDDDERLEKCRVPEEHRCVRTKTEIAINLLRAAKENGAPNHPVVADAGYGDSRGFRDAINELGWHYLVAISSNTTVWPPGSQPRRPRPTGKKGRPPSFERDARGAQPLRVDKLAVELWERGAFRNVTWRHGSKGKLRGSFTAVRIRSAERRTKDRSASEPIWLLIERDETQKTGFKYYLSSLPKSTSLRSLVKLAKVRWRIERDYQDMKQKLGLDSYEGRTWGGFHRHLAMVALIHAFLSLHRERFSPGEQEQHMEVVRVSPCPTCGAHALGRTLPDVPAAP